MIRKRIARNLIATALVTTLSAPVLAYPDFEQGPEELYEESVTVQKGTGLGALAGAVAGGPVGMFIGAWLGNTLAQREVAEERLASSNDRLRGREQELASLRDTLRRHQEMRKVMLARASAVKKPAWPDLRPVLERGVVVTIPFRTGSAEVEPDYRDQLRLLASTLREVPQLEIYLDGYADPRGEERFNQQLSTGRVERVMELLMAEGVEGNRIYLKAHGETHSAAGDSPDIFALQRRVTIRFALPGSTI